MTVRRRNNWRLSAAAITWLFAAAGVAAAVFIMGNLLLPKGDSKPVRAIWVLSVAMIAWGFLVGLIHVIRLWREWRVLKNWGNSIISRDQVATNALDARNASVLGDRILRVDEL